MAPARRGWPRASASSITCSSCSPHGAFDLSVDAKGDLHVDQHHTVEDTAFAWARRSPQALGDKTGIRRYGHFTLPMEETLCTPAVDLGGRPYLVFRPPSPARRRSATSTASWSSTSGRPLPPTPCATCTSCSTTAATATTSPRRSSRAWPARCAWPSNRPAHHRRAQHQGHAHVVVVALSLYSRDQTWSRRPASGRSTRDAPRAGLLPAKRPSDTQPPNIALGE
jgi:hypothetical protein